MIIGSNYLNIDLATHGLYRVVTGDGMEMSGLFPYAEIHMICFCICIKEDTLYREFDNVLADVPDTYAIWLSFDDLCYHAKHMDYVQEMHELYIGTIEEIKKWLRVIR